MEHLKLEEALSCFAGSAVTWLRGTQARGSFKDLYDFKDNSVNDFVLVVEVLWFGSY